MSVLVFCQSTLQSFADFQSGFRPFHGVIEGVLVLYSRESSHPDRQQQICSSNQVLAQEFHNPEEQKTCGIGNQRPKDSNTQGNLEHRRCGVGSPRRNMVVASPD